jgi:eukaryotic-like serine/threonine-protein kinase
MILGQLIDGRFEVERFVARGGMGDVYRGVDRRGGLPVALKLLVCDKPVLIERLGLEARALTELDHPAIVRPVAHGVCPDHGPYLAMEWLEGTTLSERIARQPLDVDDSLALAARVAAGLAAAHGRGMVHRDIKPSNLLLVDDRPERVKIVDFGIARLGVWQQLTADGGVVGTPAYMAPEQIRSDRALGPAADVFALGCVLFRCLTSESPFPGRRVEAVLAQIAMIERAPRVSSFRPHVPDAVDELVAAMMSHDPADRPADGGAALTWIQRAREAARAAGPTRAGTGAPADALTSREVRPLAVIFAQLSIPRGHTLTAESAEVAPRPTSGRPAQPDVQDTLPTDEPVHRSVAAARRPGGQRREARRAARGGPPVRR